MGWLALDHGLLYPTWILDSRILPRMCTHCCAHAHCRARGTTHNSYTQRHRHCTHRCLAPRALCPRYTHARHDARCVYRTLPSYRFFPHTATHAPCTSHIRIPLRTSRTPLLQFTAMLPAPAPAVRLPAAFSLLFCTTPLPQLVIHSLVRPAVRFLGCGVHPRSLHLRSAPHAHHATTCRACARTGALPTLWFVHALGSLGRWLPVLRASPLFCVVPHLPHTRISHMRLPLATPRAATYSAPSRCRAFTPALCCHHLPLARRSGSSISARSA